MTPAEEVRILVSGSKFQRKFARGLHYPYYKNGMPAQLQVEMSSWMSLCMHLSDLQHECYRKQMPGTLWLVTPFGILLVLGDFTDLQNQTWFVVTFAVYFVFMLVAASRIERPFVERLHEDYKVAVEEMTPEFEEQGYSVELVMEKDCVGTDLIYMRFLPNENMHAREAEEGISAHQEMWEAMYAKLEAFKKQHGHVDVPYCRDGENKDLFNWLWNQQRRQLDMKEKTWPVHPTHYDPLSIEEYQKLVDLGVKFR